MYQFSKLMNERKNSNDLQEIIAQVLNEMKSELGNQFDISTINLAELERQVIGLSRGRLRRLQKPTSLLSNHMVIGKRRIQQYYPVLQASLMIFCIRGSQTHQSALHVFKSKDTK